MRKNIIMCIVCCAVGFRSMAQQDPHFSQYMFNTSYWSPALTAIDDKASVSLLSRAQWVGYEPTNEQDGGAPSSQFLNFSTPVAIKKIPLGVGVNVIYDIQGPMHKTEAHLSIAYHKAMNQGTLSFGVRPQFIAQTLDFTKLRFVDPSDPKNIQSNESQSVFDLAFGMAYSTKNLRLGAGVNHLLQPKVNYPTNGPDTGDNSIGMIYNLYAEYTYRLTYNIDLKPSALITSDINTYSFDLSVLAEYNKKLWGGLSYRNNEAMTLLLGYSFLANNQLKAGYAFDYIIKQQSAKQPTSHEIFIRYDLPSISSGAKKIIRTPRFRYE